MGIDLGLFDKTLIRVAERLRKRGHILDYQLQPGASESHIARCEREIGLALPASLRTVLRQHNGGAISLDREKGLSHDLYLSSTDDIVQDDREYRIFFADRDRSGYLIDPASGQHGETRHFWSGLISFAKYGVGTCVLDSDNDANSEYAVLDLDITYAELTRSQVIATSLCDWFTKLFESAEANNTLVYWLPGSDD